MTSHRNQIRAIKQKIRETFLLVLECFLLLLGLICGPQWTHWPTGVLWADFLLWSLICVTSIWGSYTFLRKMREQKFGPTATPPSYWEFLFNFLTPIVLGIPLMVLPFFYKAWKYPATPFILALLGLITITRCDWKLFQLGNKI